MVELKFYVKTDSENEYNFTNKTERSAYVCFETKDCRRVSYKMFCRVVCQIFNMEHIFNSDENNFFQLI